MCAARNARPAGMGVVSELVSHSLQRAPEEELIQRKPAVALKIKKDRKNGTVPSVWRRRTGRGGMGLGLAATRNLATEFPPLGKKCPL